MIISFRRRPILKYILLFSLSIYIAYSYYNILQCKLINPDGGFYLWLVNKIPEGKIPGIDIKTWYTPLVFYLLSVVRVFTHSPTYSLYLCILLIIQLLNASLLYCISKQYTTNKFIPFLAFLLYLLMSFHSDGSFFVLEPFVNLLGLLSLVTYFKFRNCNSFYMLVAGFLAALSFFCKQYGLAYSFAIPLLLWIDFKNTSLISKKTIFYTIGYAIPFVAFILYYRVEGYGFKEIISNYSGSGYGQRSLNAYFRGLYEFVKIYCIFFPFSLWVLIKKGFRDHILVYLYLIAGFSLQFFFNKFPHYYLLLIPYVIILAIIIYESLIEKHKLLLLFVFLLLFTLIINIYANILFTKNYSGSKTILKENLTEQTKNSILINNYVGKNDKVLIFDFDLAPYYFLCNINPPLEKKYGMIYFDIVSLDGFLENISQTDFVLIWEESLTKFYSAQRSVDLRWIEVKISSHLVLLKKDI